jgi:hypothetical protein
MRYLILSILVCLLSYSSFPQYWGPATPFPGATLDISGTFQNCTNSNTPYIVALCEYNGDLFVGGNFTSIGGLVSHGIARWNGTTWNSLGNANFLQTCVYDIVSFNGKLYFTSDKLYEWDGSTISNFTYFNTSSQQTLPVGGSDLHVYNNELYIVSTSDILKFNGINFSQIDDGQLSINCLDDFNNNLFAGSDQGLFKFQNGSWIDCNGSVSSTPIISDIEPFNNELFVSGVFTSIGGLSTNNLAKYNGTNWSSLNFVNGYSPTFGGSLRKLNNELYFANTSPVIPQGVVSCPLIKYNGAQWIGISSNAFYGGLTSIIYNNKLYVGGTFNYIQYQNNTPVNVQGFAKLDGSLEIEENNLDFFELFPNPVNTTLTINTKFANNNLNYFILNSFGEIVQTGKLTKEKSNINIDLTSGVYFLKIGDQVKKISIIK